MERSHSELIYNEVGQAARTDRTVNAYCKYFGFQPEELRGMNILDIGAGDSNFADTVNSTGANVVRLDAKYSEKPPCGNADAVTGIVQALPFKSGSFDLALASFSLYWVATDVDKALLEMIRIVRDNGLIKIFPTLIEGNENAIRRISRASKIETPETSMAKTLVIKKNPAYSDEKWKNIAGSLVRTCDFRTYYSADSQTNISLLKPLEEAVIGG